MTLKKAFLLLILLFPLTLTARQIGEGDVSDGYKNYIQNPTIYDLDSLQGLVDWLNERSLDPREHLEMIYGIHFENTPIDTKNITKLDREVELGVSLMNAEDMSFQILGDILLQALSDSIQNGLNTEYLDKGDSELLAVINKLKAAQYGVSIPVSDKEKLYKNLREGNLNYVFTRLRTRCILDCSNGACDPMCKWFWAILFTGLVSLILIIVYRKKIRLWSRIKSLRRS